MGGGGGGGGGWGGGGGEGGGGWKGGGGGEDGCPSISTFPVGCPSISTFAVHSTPSHLHLPLWQLLPRHIQCAHKLLVHSPTCAASRLCSEESGGTDREKLPPNGGGAGYLPPNAPLAAYCCSPFFCAYQPLTYSHSLRPVCCTAHGYLNTLPCHSTRLSFAPLLLLDCATRLSFASPLLGDCTRLSLARYRHVPSGDSLFGGGAIQRTLRCRIAPRSQWVGVHGSGFVCLRTPDSHTYSVLSS